jgi:hypothetical protein
MQAEEFNVLAFIREVETSIREAKQCGVEIIDGEWAHYEESEPDGEVTLQGCCPLSTVLYAKGETTVLEEMDYYDSNEEACEVAAQLMNVPARVAVIFSAIWDGRYTCGSKDGGEFNIEIQNQQEFDLVKETILLKERFNRGEI